MKSQQKTLSYWIYRIIRWFVWVFYPSITVEGRENLPDQPCVIVGNHGQMNGPIVGQLYFPGKPRIWCSAKMMHIREVPQYAFEDFWRDKPKNVRWFYRLLSYIIAPLSACVFSNADTIAVYHDNRLVSTFKQTISTLENGTNVIIFPECREEYNHIVNRFQDRYIDVAKLCYKRNGQSLKFVPMYIAPKLKKVYIGEPTQFRPDAPMADERQRISQYLMEQITEISEKLPRHIVVPYTNMPRKQYSFNIPEEANANEKAVVDYREFRLSRINEPRFSHLKLLLAWVGYFLLYVLTENLIPAERCYPVHSVLDDMIPFNEWFVIFYVGWYGLIVFSLGYFLLYNIENFKGLQGYIIVTQVLAMVMYIAFPTRQDLRPAEFPRDNILTDIISILYSADTNTGVCPSLHVAYSLGIASAWLKEKSASVTVKVLVVIAVILICLSTMFIKQHSAVDFFAALPVCLIAEFIAFRQYYKNKRLQGMQDPK